MTNLISTKNEESRQVGEFSRWSRDQYR